MKGIVIVDCGMGNLHSIHAGLCRTGTRMPITLSDKAADIAAAEKVVLPGDGHFDSCMKEIRRRGLCDELIRATRKNLFWVFVSACKRYMKAAKKAPKKDSAF